MTARVSDSRASGVVVVDSGIGNLGSMLNMLRKIGVQSARGSADPDVILSAARLILPGIGAFDRGMKNLAERQLIGPLTQKVIQQGTPILGVCLGMELFTRGSEEGTCPGLGWLDAMTVRIRPAVQATRVPHMGWNWVEFAGTSRLRSELEDEARFYFAHGYYVIPGSDRIVEGTTEYGGIRFASAMRQENIFGVQFHPEKSHSFGMRLLRNFIEA